MEYKEFLKQKEVKVIDSGMDVADEDINKHLFDYQHDIVKWALKKGKSAVFAGTTFKFAPDKFMYGLYSGKNGANVKTSSPGTVTHLTA